MMTSKSPINMEGLETLFGNFTNLSGYDTNSSLKQDGDNSIELRTSLSIIYAIIFLSGLLGNVSTCLVIARNRSMHTATNFYLFSLAISDLVLLLCGLPIEMYQIWIPSVYPLDEISCIGLGLASEMSTNATILTIAAFTIERYIAICRPFMSHTMSKLSRAIRIIIGIWVFALCTAIPQAMQFGIVVNKYGISCTLKGIGVHQFFVISSFIFFVVPMSLLSVLYAQIGLKLRNSSILHPIKKPSIDSNGRPSRGYRSTASQRRVIRMLVAVALSFFVCWCPFHVQRLLAIYGKTMENPSEAYQALYICLTYISGVLYYLSTAINPILYNIMSNKFRTAFKTTLAAWFGRHSGARMARTYSTLLASRRERFAAEQASRANGVRRLHRYNTATTQVGEAPPRAQRVEAGDCHSVSEGSGCGRWGLAWRLRMSLEHASCHDSIRSISNSSLREFEEELTGEELATFMHQVNVDIGFT